jgi:hypothetical protein
MTRKFLNTIRSEITTLLADNTTQDITASELRQVVGDILDSTYESSAYVYSGAASPGEVLTNTYVVVPMASPVSAQAEPTFLTANAANRQVNVLAAAVGFAISAVVEATVTVPNNEVVEFAIFQNGVATRWTAETSGSGGGAGDPHSISLGGVLIGSVGTIDLRYRCPTGATITVLSASLLVSMRPTNVAL